MLLATAILPEFVPCPIVRKFDEADWLQMTPVPFYWLRHLRTESIISKLDEAKTTSTRADCLEMTT
jgi:hypothetical protein